MRRAPSLAALVALAAAGCFPDFQFGGGGGGDGGNPSSSRASGPGTTTNAGAGGAFGGGGSTSPAGGAGDGGSGGGHEPSSTTSSMVEPTLPCGDGNGTVVPCPTTEDACCVSLDSPSLDKCEATSNCGSSFYTLRCQDQGDCPGQICCAVFDEDFLGVYFTGLVTCAASCPAPSRRMCQNAAADCNAGQTCKQLFADSFAPEYAPHYRFCD